ncbi:MAG: hypothetical protein F4213_03235 [Boseongicola sp. SB0677_bin_26]|nr:hypothetical protein [Boseongicola sp. SB0677_bin_26]
MKRKLDGDLSRIHVPRRAPSFLDWIAPTAGKDRNPGRPRATLRHESAKSPVRIGGPAACEFRHVPDLSHFLDRLFARKNATARNDVGKEAQHSVLPITGIVFHASETQV